MRKQPSYRNLVIWTIEPEVVVGIIAQVFRIKKEVLMRCGANGEIRGIVAELLYKYCDITQSQIGSYLGGIDYVSVHQLRRRLLEKMNKNSELKKQCKKPKQE